MLCAGGRGNLDDAAAAILAQVLARRGVEVRVVPHEAMAASTYGSLELAGVRMICLSYMNPESVAQARYLVRRLRRRTDVPILVCLWSRGDGEDATDLAAATGATGAVTSLQAGVSAILADLAADGPGGRVPRQVRTAPPGPDAIDPAPSAAARPAT